MTESADTVDPVEAERLACTDAAVLVDVRENDEWRAGHAPAGNVPAHNMAGGMAAWADAGRPVIRDDETPGTVI